MFDVLEEVRGPGEAVLFARSATAGGQQMPVHWGGDNSSTFASMAESLRGGLSLALSGFGYWSHDIGGFEGDPDPAVFKRWLAFGLLSSHSRLHGSTSYRVPWVFDAATRSRARARSRWRGGSRSSSARCCPTSSPRARRRTAPGGRSCARCSSSSPTTRRSPTSTGSTCSAPSLLVAPVFSADGEVEYYLPAGRWTNWFTHEVVEGGGWRREVHGFDTVPLWVREGAVVPMVGEDGTLGEFRA